MTPAFYEQKYIRRYTEYGAFFRRSTSWYSLLFGHVRQKSDTLLYADFFKKKTENGIRNTYTWLQ